MSTYPSLSPARPINDVLVSILIYNYKSGRLEDCLQTIFAQNALENFEVILGDDASSDGAWAIANTFAKRYDGKITITRNNLSLGKEANREKLLQMCRGNYSVELTDSARFLAGYVRKCIEGLETDPYLEHSYISRVKPSNVFLPLRNKYERDIKIQAEAAPLVSICVYNYNYGRYLRQCLASAFSQTYPNIEVCFSDNASTDESWQIANEFAESNPESMSLTRNRVNYGPNINLLNCSLNMRGKYVLKLCSDDAMHPEFIERCVVALEQHPEAAFAMVHREILDEHNNRVSEPSFYDRSCLIPGSGQAAVYMMSSVNPSISQILYNLPKLEGKRMAGNLNDRWFGDRICDFHLCCDSSIVYLKEPLLLNRVHSASDGAALEGNLLQCISEYVLVHQFSDIAGGQPGMQKSVGRLSDAIEKIGRLCIRYSLRALRQNDEYSARRYYHLGLAIFPNIDSDSTFQTLSEYWQASSEDRHVILEALSALPNLASRLVSYSPPEGSVAIYSPATVAA